jgi:hypothetical protein
MALGYSHPHSLAHVGARLAALGSAEPSRTSATVYEWHLLFSGPGRSGHYRRLCLWALVSIAVRGSVSAVKAKTPSVPRPVLDVLLAVYRASAGKTHSRYYVSVDRLALPLNRQRATAAIEMGVLSVWLTGGGSPVHSVALTDEGLGVLRARHIID